MKVLSNEVTAGRMPLDSAVDDVVSLLAGLLIACSANPLRSE